MQKRDSTGSPGDARPTDEGASILARYLGEIGDTPVLSRRQEQEIARRFCAMRRRTHEVLAGLPPTGAALCDRWQRHRERPNPLRGLVAEPEGAAPRGVVATVEATVARVERRLRRAPPTVPSGPRDERAWERFERRQREDLLGIELRSDFYQEVEREIWQQRERLDAASRPGERRRVRGEVGFPLLRFRRRLRTLESLASDRDQARNELARHNVRLVVRFAKDFRNLGVDFTDLIQEGNIGLLRAIELFEPERALKFSTYAVWWIRQSLVRAVQKQSRTVRLPSHVNDRLYHLGRTTDRLAVRLGRAPSNGEIARESGLETDRVERLRALVKLPLSLDGGEDSEELRPLHERLPDGRVEDPLERIDSARERRALGRLLPRLDAREQVVVGRRFGFSGEERVTLDRLAREIGLSRELVRRIEKRALAKLRGWLAESVPDEA